ncbi:MAG: glycosyltransferase [Bacteroidales bacterium]|nr:glycosyltransferase [Bacteroidales bacterium]
MVLLSIIVPVYNVEQYLNKCVDSLLTQDLMPDEYEIILVDDGSPDRCGAICDDYALRYSNIKVIHRENGGIGAARNSGIEEACGKYVQFVDSDDYLEPNVLKSLVDKMEHDQLDVLRFNYQNVNDHYEVFEPNKISKPFVDYRDEVCDGLTFLTERLGFACYACQFMMKRELLDGCRFKEGVYFEDTEWTPRLLMLAARVTSTNLMVYNYLMRIGSISRGKDEATKKKVKNDELSLIDALKEQMSAAKDKRWFEGMIAQTVLSLVGFVSGNYYENRKQLFRELKSKRILPLSVYHSTPSARRKIRLANVSLGLLGFVLHIK